MIVAGEFPFLSDSVEIEEAPRVGDGVLLLDGSARVEYASPNAVNALHRMGINSNADGMRLDELGVQATAITNAYASAMPHTEDVEPRPDVTVLIRCIPLLDAGKVTGSLVLMRDVSDLRRRDRLLLSKDAAIREVHHRVKNNLQTISSLLRLQARRLPVGEGRTALDEAERRIRSIALVHEILSRDPGEQVAFNDIVPHLVRMAEDAVLAPDRTVEFHVSGDAGELPAAVATPLAVVLSELLQNAAEHAFVEPQVGGGLVGLVGIVLTRDEQALVAQVIDNGSGLPDGFSLEKTDSLGLSIVRDLVVSQLGGSMAMHTDGGTVVELRVPLDSPAV
jgi:two-component sensor histidine kinase